MLATKELKLQKPAARIGSLDATAPDSSNSRECSLYKGHSWWYLGVSKNNGTPKWMVYDGL